MLALARARESGIVVERSVTLHAPDTGRVRFHGVTPELVEAQARAVGLEPIVRAVEWDAMPEVWAEILGGLAEDGFAGMVFGNLHLHDVRAWYEEKVRDAGLRHHEPLWRSDPESVVREFLDRGFRARVVCVDLRRAPPTWLGAELDHALVDAFVGAGIDPCGEHGEYHTFVYDGPGFAAPVPVRTGEVVEDGSFRILTLDPAAAPSPEDDE